MKIYAYLLVFGIALQLVGCGDKEKENREQAERHLKSAYTYIEQGQLRAAVLEAQNIVRLLPQDARGFIVLGKIYNQIGAYNTSQQVLGKVVEKLPEVSTELAESNLQIKKYRTAIDLLNDYPAKPEDKSAQQQQEKIRALANIYLGDKGEYEKALATFASLDGDKAQQAYIEATYALAQGKPESAQTLLEQALIIDPENIEALRLLGGIASYTGQLDKAEAYLTKALGLLPKTDVLSVERSQTLSQLIEVLIQQGRTSEAYTYQKVLAEANPESSAAQQRFNEALEYYQQGKFEEAEAILTELREQFPTDKNTATLLGMIEFQQGADDKAAGLFDEFIDPETATSTVIQAAALVKYRSNKMDEAVAMLKKATESQPNNAAILATYGLAVLELDNKSAEGAKALEKSLAINPKQQRIRIALAKRYIAMEQPEQAIGQLQKAYQEQPLDLVIQQAYLKALFDQKQIERIKNEVADFKKSHPDSSRGPFIEGWLLLEQKDYAGAEKAFTQALAMPQNTEKQLAYSGLAKIYELQNNPQKAATAWQHTIEQSPTISTPYGQWLRHMKALNRLDDAEVFLKQLESSAKAWQPSLVLAELMVVKGNLDAAIIHIEKALEISQQAKLVKQKAAGLYQLKGMDLRNKKQLTEARNYFLKAIKLYPESPGFLSSLIETEIAAENIPEAQKLLDQFIKTDENLAARHYLQGVIRFAEKNPEEGLKQYRLSWGAKPTEKAAESIYGYYQQNGLTQEKERFLDEWLEKIPNSYRVAFIKAVEAQNKNDKKNAIHWYEKTLAAAPNAPVALNNLAWLYYETKDSRALGLAEKAAQFAPNSASILDTYGWIMVETGSVQEGIGILQKASDLEPANAEIKTHLEQAKARRK